MNDYKGPKIVDPNNIKYITEPKFKFTILDNPDYLADLSGERVYYKVSEKEYIYGPLFYDHIVSKGYKWYQLFPPVVKPEASVRGWAIESEIETPDPNPIMKDFNINIYFPVNGFRENKKIYNVIGSIIKGVLNFKNLRIRPKVSDAMKKKIGDEMLKHYNNSSI